MVHTKSLHTCIASILIVAMFSLMTAGLVIAKPADVQEAPSVSQQSEGCSFTARPGSGTKHQPLESSQYDHNPSCCHHTATLAYNPDITLLILSEQFTAVSPVYFERFVPPQNIL